MGLGAFGLAPDVFWNMTPFELWCVMDAKLEMSGRVKPITRSELEKLEQEVAARRAARKKAEQ